MIFLAPTVHGYDRRVAPENNRYTDIYSVHVLVYMHLENVMDDNYESLVMYSSIVLNTETENLY